MMWQVLFLVHALPVTVVMVALAVLAVLSVLVQRRWPGFVLRACRVLLALAVVLYIAILVGPIGGWGDSGRGSGAIALVPFSSAGTDPATKADEGTEVFLLADGGELYSDYSGNLSRGRVEEMREQAAEHGAEYAVSRYVTEDGAEVIFDSEGQSLSAEHEAEVEAMVTDPEDVPHSAGLAWEEMVANLLLFVPIGMVSYFAVQVWAVRLLVGPALSLVIELSQWLLPTGRLADTTDLIVNGSGHVLGVGFVGVAGFLFRRGHAEA